MDSDGDIAMVDVETGEEPATTDVIRVPIRRRVDSSILAFIPYDNPAVWDFSWDDRGPASSCSRDQRFPGITLLRYTNAFGRRAAQPTAGGARELRRYLAALDEAEDDVAAADYGDVARGRCDPVLREARAWSCWAQGFRFLEFELRWTLTLVFDFANVMMARQRQDAAVGGKPALLL